MAVVVVADVEAEEAGTATVTNLIVGDAGGTNRRLFLDLKTLTDATGQGFFTIFYLVSHATRPRHTVYLRRA